MDDYRILLPVTGSPELVKIKLEKDIPDLSKLILVNNFDNRDVYDLCIRARDNGATLYYHPENFGLAASWNIGLHYLEQNPSCGFVIFLSASAKFNQPIEKFIDQIRRNEETKKYHRYIATSMATLHCFAHTQLAVTDMGFFDENFYPIYIEDTDMSYRSTLLREGGCEILVHTFNNPSSLVQSINFSNAVNTDKRLFKQYQMNVGRMGDYWKRKWSGCVGAGEWKFPFNNCTLPVNYWEKEGSFVALDSKGPNQWDK